MPSSDGQFQPGYDPRRVSPGRPTPLSDPAFVELVATMFINGMTRQQMLDELHAQNATSVRTVDTIGRWKKDPRVKAAADKLLRERIGIIAARTDAEILKRLEAADKLTVKEILAIRNEFMGGKMRDKMDDVDAETVNEMQDWLADNPEEAAALEGMLSGSNPSDES